MDGTLELLTMIESWQQVAVIVAILAYLVVRSHLGARRTKKLKADMETAATAVAAVDTGITAVLHQVENNSGSSMKDAVDRIESGQAELVEIVVPLVAQVNATAEAVAALEAKYLDPTGKHDPGL